jgi:hypothetical protein
VLLLAENDTRVEAGVRNAPGVFTVLRGVSTPSSRVISHFFRSPGPAEPVSGLAEYGETGGYRTPQRVSRPCPTPTPRVK